MGANAQTSVPTFTAGQVLTAAQMNDSARTGVPVFADTTARDAGFGATGEKTLAEGQLCYLESTNVVQYYDGSSWATVGPQTVTTPGMELVVAQTIGSAVSSVTVTGAFSATYDAYKIIVTGGASSGATALRMTLGATATGYSGQLIYGTYNNTTLSAGATNQTSWLYAGAGDTDSLSMCAEVWNPFLSERTYLFAANAESSNGGVFSGYLNNTTSYTAFTLTTGSGTITGGTVRVYGYKN
jgi:hypothetical protein